AGEEIRKVDRTHLGPDAARGTKVRDAAFGRDAGAGKRHDDAGTLHQLAQAIDGGRNIGGDHGMSRQYGRRGSGRPAHIRGQSVMKYLHTMLRVRNLDAALHFYVDLLGMKEARRRVDDKNKYTLVFLYAPEDEAVVKASME